MAVLDVAIPTGYIIQQQKLDSYILSKRVRNLQRAKFAEKKVLFYFDFVSLFDRLVWCLGSHASNLLFSWITKPLV